jgi:hypothetical protein
LHQEQAEGWALARLYYQFPPRSNLPKERKMLRNPVSKRSVISISLGLLALAAMPLALRPRAAQADEGTPFKGAFTVQAVLIQPSPVGLPERNCAPVDNSFDNSCKTCVTNSNAFAYVDAQGIGDTSLGTMFIKVLKCAFNATPGKPNGSYDGTFSMTAPNRKDSVSGTYSGVNDTPDPLDFFYGWGPFSGTLTITAGTGKFEGAKGSANFTATAGQFGTEASPQPSTDVLVMAFYAVQGNLELSGGI